LSIIDPDNSIDLAFNNSVANATANFGDIDATWNFSAFEDSTIYPSSVQAFVRFSASGTVSGDADIFKLQVHDSTSWNDLTGAQFSLDSLGINSLRRYGPYDVSAILDDLTKLNAAQIRFVGIDSDAGEGSDDSITLYIDELAINGKSYTAAYFPNNYRDTTYAADNLGLWCTQCHTRYMAGGGAGHNDSGDAIFTYRHNTSGSFLSCIRCHVAHGTSATMGTYSGTVPWPGGDTSPSGDERSALLHTNNRGVCAQCHVDLSGQVYMHGTGGGTGGGGGGGCEDCHGYTGSHATHTTVNSKGPATPLDDCADCHDTSNYPNFNDGKNLNDTDVCNTCHSPGGTYDGVDDPIIGAKNNWSSGVYNSPLPFAKRQWCVGCHDEQAAVIDGVTAPDVSLFWSTDGGHGRNDAVVCEDCHDTSTGTHIDGEDRTYTYTGVGQSYADYQTGYRLKMVGGEFPMAIPKSDSLPEVNDYRLCLECHPSADIFDDTAPYATNFNNSGVNAAYGFGSYDVNSHRTHTLGLYPSTGQIIDATSGKPHWLHSSEGLFWDSDWDPSTGDAGKWADSGHSCVTCHNIHGSTYPGMIRDGKLVDRDKDSAATFNGLEFSYITDAGFPTVTSTGATQANSLGGIMRVGFNGNPANKRICRMQCHQDSPAPYPEYTSSTGLGDECTVCHINIMHGGNDDSIEFFRAPI
ncbi:MAG: cytochrome c3 family protein, partial [Chloroflexota bacterium]|nr:cytochrome c3 family protein [Chloroflexota bacterium]